MPSVVPVNSLLAALAALSAGSACAQSASAAVQREAVLEEQEVRSVAGSPSLQSLPASASVLDGEAMRDRQMQVNLSESLVSVPGLQIRNRQNYAQDVQLSIRGYGARSTFGLRGVRLYVDGIPATMPDGQGSLSHIDIGSLERVEVLRGPYSALYGNSAGGVVSMYTETPEAPPSLESSMALGSDGQRRLAGKASGQTEQGMAYMVSASRFLTDGYRHHSAADRNVLNAKLSIPWSVDQQLTLIANAMDMDALDAQGVTWADWQKSPRAAAATTLNFKTRKSLSQTQAGALYEHRVNAQHSLALSVYAGHRSMEQYQSIPVAAQNAAGHAGGVIDMSRDFAGLDLRWSGKFLQAPLPFTATAGVALDYVQEDRQGYENFRGSALGVKGNLRRNEKNTITNADPYVQATWQWAPSWSMDTGVRYSSVKFRSDDYYINARNPDDSGRVTHRKALPVVSLAHRLTPQQTLYASAGRGFETPTLAELSYRPDSIGGLNLGLQPAVSTQYELGYRQRLQGALQGSWSAALFQSRTKEEIVSAGAANGRTSYRNAGQTRRQGLELQADVRLAAPWQLQLAYTYLDAVFRQSSVDVPAGNMLPGLAKQRVWMALDYRINQAWRIGLSAEHMAKVYVNDSNTEAAPAYTVAAASIGYRKEIGAWTLQAFGRIDNLLDRQYIGSVIVNDGNGRYYEAAPGRSWSAGANLAYRF